MKQKDFKVLCKQIKDGEWRYYDGNLTKDGITIRCRSLQYLCVGGNYNYLNTYQEIVLWWLYIIPFKYRTAKDEKAEKEQRLTDQIIPQVVVHEGVIDEE